MSMRCALWSSWVPVRPGVAPLRLLAALAATTHCVRGTPTPTGCRAATPLLRAPPAPLWRQPEAHWLRSSHHPMAACSRHSPNGANPPADVAVGIAQRGHHNPDGLADGAADHLDHHQNADNDPAIMQAAREPARLRVLRCRRWKRHRAHPCAGMPPNPGLPRARFAGSAYLEHSRMLENEVSYRL